AGDHFNFTDSAFAFGPGFNALFLGNISAKTAANITSSVDINGGTITAPNVNLVNNGFFNGGGIHVNVNAAQLTANISNPQTGQFPPNDITINDSAPVVTILGTNRAINYRVNATTGSIVIGAGVT